jgi:hypothetical protein
MEPEDPLPYSEPEWAIGWMTGVRFAAGERDRRPGPPGWESFECETVKYSHEFPWTRTRKWLRWRGLAVIIIGTYKGFWRWPSIQTLSIFNVLKVHNLSKSGSMSFLRWKGGEEPTQLGPLDYLDLKRLVALDYVWHTQLSRRLPFIWRQKWTHFPRHCVHFSISVWKSMLSFMKIRQLVHYAGVGGAEKKRYGTTSPWVRVCTMHLTILVFMFQNLYRWNCELYLSHSGSNRTIPILYRPVLYTQFCPRCPRSVLPKTKWRVSLQVISEDLWLWYAQVIQRVHLHPVLYHVW